jgi:hypothetical protein
MAREISGAKPRAVAFKRLRFVTEALNNPKI